MATAIVCGLIAGMMVLSFGVQPVVEENIRSQWVQQALGDADPGAGNTGFMYIMVYPHSADPGTDYASNLTNSSAYEYSDSTDCELTGETPHGVAVDFVVKSELIIQMDIILLVQLGKIVGFVVI